MYHYPPRLIERIAEVSRGGTVRVLYVSASVLLGEEFFAQDEQGMLTCIKTCTGARVNHLSQRWGAVGCRETVFLARGAVVQRNGDFFFFFFFFFFF